MRELFLRAARGERTERPPVWLMRQAGRYLPEYREIRSEHPFLEAIHTPEIAERISVQPYDRFEPDGVVMYSDILTVLEPLGFDYRLESGVGPVVDDPITSPADVDIDPRPVDVELDYVGELIARLRDRLGDRAAVIGFAGGPFTIAAYLVEGRPSRSFMALRRFRAAHPDAFRSLLETIADVVADVLEFQAANGADVVQLFDTYAGLLAPADYRRFLLPLHARIFDRVESTPSIVFVRNLGGDLSLLGDSGADVVSLDWTVDIGEARSQLGDVPVQGNLDPAYLFGSESFVRSQTRATIEAAGDAGHILNLGHGLHKETPVESVAAFVDTAKSIDRR